MPEDAEAMTWPFDDPVNVAVITSADIVERGEWIRTVFHDEEDGGWQFHSRHGAPDDLSEARVCSLQGIFTRDPSIGSLADLPYGWCAWRDSPGSAWQRAPSD